MPDSGLILLDAAGQRIVDPATGKGVLTDGSSACGCCIGCCTDPPACFIVTLSGIDFTYYSGDSAVVFFTFDSSSILDQPIPLRNSFIEAGNNLGTGQVCQVYAFPGNCDDPRLNGAITKFPGLTAVPLILTYVIMLDPSGGYNVLFAAQIILSDVFNGSDAAIAVNLFLGEGHVDHCGDGITLDNELICTHGGGSSDTLINVCGSGGTATITIPDSCPAPFPDNSCVPKCFTTYEATQNCGDMTNPAPHWDITKVATVCSDTIGFDRGWIVNGSDANGFAKHKWTVGGTVDCVEDGDCADTPAPPAPPLSWLTCPYCYYKYLATPNCNIIEESGLHVQGYDVTYDSYQCSTDDKRTGWLDSGTTDAAGNVIFSKIVRGPVCPSATCTEPPDDSYTPSPPAVPGGGLICIPCFTFSGVELLTCIGCDPSGWSAYFGRYCGAYNAGATVTIGTSGSLGCICLTDSGEQIGDNDGSHGESDGDDDPGDWSALTSVVVTVYCTPPECTGTPYTFTAEVVASKNLDGSWDIDVFAFAVTLDGPPPDPFKFLIFSATNVPTDGTPVANTYTTLNCVMVGKNGSVSLSYAPCP